LHFGGLWGRRLHAIDCQGLFCELDKYCREAVPQLTSIRTRIKTRFKASHEPIRLFFPPKWHLNELIKPKVAINSKNSEFRLISDAEGHRQKQKKNSQ